MANKICPMKFSMFTDILNPGVIKAGRVDCETDSCAWWDTEMKTCHVARVGKFMESLHRALGDIAGSV